MRKLLDEKFILYKMSNRNLMENKLFSKVESSADGREWSSGSSRNPGVSNAQKRRDKCEAKCQESINTNKTIEKKSKELDMRKESSTVNCNPYVLCHHYNGIYSRRQQTLCSNFMTNGILPNCFVPNPYYFYRSLSESSVPCQQLSSIYFNSYQNYDDTSGISLDNRSARRRNVNSFRSWQMTTLGRILQKLNGGKNPGITFKVMTYNVLAQDLLECHPELYKHNDLRTLEWEIRWKNIYQEIKEQNCEIICLQEVQQDHLDKYYDTLKALGYTGIYKRKTGSRSDGCAIYYKKSLFNLIEQRNVEYLQQDISVLDRDNVGLILTLAPKDNPSAEFIVATTHLLYNPKRHDVRLAQMQVLLAEIERLAYRHDESDPKYIPIILTGDFNSLPRSPVIDFIVTRKYKYENTMLRHNYAAGKVLIPSWLMITDNCQHAGLLKYRSENRTLTRKQEEKYIQLSNNISKADQLKQRSEYTKHKFGSGTLSHQFILKSAYKHQVNNDVEGTTFQGEWVTVDYIFYSGIHDDGRMFKDDKLKMLARYVLPTRSQLDPIRIPNIEQGSDHLALLTAFKLEY